MHRSVARLGLLAAPVLLIAACGATDSSTAITGSGRVTSEARTVGEFTAVAIDGPFAASITVGSPADVTVTSDDNVVPAVVTRLDGRTLVVELKPNTSIRNSSGLKVRVAVPALTGAKADAAARLSISGVTGPRFSLDLDAAAQADASGTVERVDVVAKAASVARLGSLKATSATVSLDAASVAEMAVTDRIDGSAKAASVLKLIGRPATAVTTSEASTIVNQ